MNNGERHLILIGYRGSGKTTVGRRLAEKTGRKFIDADEFLEARYGMSIREIFASEGEAGFRDKESLVLGELVTGPPIVFATGGGIVLRESNRKILKNHGFVAWLTADATTLWNRTQTDPTTHERRPNLAGGGIEEVVRLLSVREPLYREIANLEIPAGELSPDVIADRILAEWNA